jgi:hypothetical protein
MIGLQIIRTELLPEANPKAAHQGASKSALRGARRQESRERESQSESQYDSLIFKFEIMSEQSETIPVVVLDLPSGKDRGMAFAALVPCFVC